MSTESTNLNPLTDKHVNFVTRLSAAVNLNTDQINILVALYSEWVLLGYATTHPIDEAAVAKAFPHLTAADLAEVMTSLATVKAYLDASGHTAKFLKMRA